MCNFDYDLFLKYFNTVWSWVTLAAAALIWFRAEIKALLIRIAKSKKLSIGPVAWDDSSPSVIDAEVPAKPTSPPSVAVSNLPPAQRVNDRILTGRVKVDDKHFDNCTFENVLLEFAGTAPVGITNCTFTGQIAWEFTGNAAMTLSFMKALSEGGFDATVAATFNSIRNRSTGSKEP